jgi:hypothetical protein
MRTIIADSASVLTQFKSQQQGDVSMDDHLFMCFTVAVPKAYRAIPVSNVDINAGGITTPAVQLYPDDRLPVCLLVDHHSVEENYVWVIDPLDSVSHDLPVGHLASDESKIVFLVPASEVEDSEIYDISQHGEIITTTLPHVNANAVVDWVGISKDTHDNFMLINKEYDVYTHVIVAFMTEYRPGRVVQYTGSEKDDKEEYSALPGTVLASSKFYRSKDDNCERMVLLLPKDQLIRIHYSGSKIFGECTTYYVKFDGHSIVVLSEI